MSLELLSWKEGSLDGSDFFIDAKGGLKPYDDDLRSNSLIIACATTKVQALPVKAAVCKGTQISDYGEEQQRDLQQNLENGSRASGE